MIKLFQEEMMPGQGTLLERVKAAFYASLFSPSTFLFFVFSSSHTHPQQWTHINAPPTTPYWEEFVNLSDMF